MPPLFIAIIAGGRGTRVWPRSRRHLPKQCLSIDGGPSLIQRTLARVAPLAPPERVLVITGGDMADAIRGQLPELPPENILVEPSGRNTAPCIGWGAVEIKRRAGPEAVMAVLPADHLIEDEGAFRAALVAGAEAACSTGSLVTLGLTPTRPETGFGYLELGEHAGDFGGRGLVQVARFVEKPDAETARAYMAGGRHLWNAGMFVFTAGAVLAAFARHLPESAATLAQIEAAPERLEALWPALEKTSIDYGIMERAERVLTVPARIGWSDVGSWTALREHLPAGEGGHTLAREVVAIDASGCVVHAPDKLVALVGVEDLVIVDAGDALLVCRADRAQDVRAVIAALEGRGRSGYL